MSIEKDMPAETREVETVQNPPFSLSAQGRG